MRRNLYASDGVLSNMSYNCELIRLIRAVCEVPSRGGRCQDICLSGKHMTPQDPTTHCRSLRRREHRFDFMPVQKSVSSGEIKTCEKFNLRHLVDIPGIQFFAQRRYLSAFGGSGK
jgi:hypothetical protein